MLNLVESFRQGRARARAELDETAPPANGAGGRERKTFLELSALADQLNARVIELEAELAASPAAIFAEVLRLEGVKTWLVSRFHPDKHRDANEAERQDLTAKSQKINAAYAALERKDGP